MSLIWRNQHDTMPEDLIELRTVEDLAALERDLVEVAGVSRTVARAIPPWVLTRASGLEDGASPNTRSRYRKALAQVLEHRPDGPGRLNGPRSRDRGAAHLTPMVGAGAVAGVAMSGAGRALLDLATPIIHEPPVTSSAELTEAVAA